MARLIATFLGIGWIKRGSGTVASLLTLPICMGVNSYPLFYQGLFWTILCFVAFWAARHFHRPGEEIDHPAIVIDEVVGMGIASLGNASTIGWLSLSFLMFRIFDIFKPFPINKIDQWSKIPTKSPNSVHPSRWVIVDDILAGLMTAIVIHFLKAYGTVIA